MKLYELVQEEKNLNALFLAAIDDETGEIKDTETLEKLEIELKNALVSKSVGIVKIVRQQEADIEMISAEIERLQDVKKRMQKSLDNFKKYIAYNIKQLELKKIETPLGNISTKETTATDVFDETILPKQFLKEKTSYTPSKIDIKKALEAGEEVPGARLIINTNLNIK